MNKQLFQKLIKIAVATISVYLVTMVSGSYFSLPGGAYLHLGDGLVLILSLALPYKTALAASVVGCAMADVSLEAYAFIIATVITKVVMVTAVKFMIKLSDNPLTQDSLIAGLGLISVAGYFMSDFIRKLDGGLLQALNGAAEGVPANILQALVSAVIYLVVSAIVRKKVKRNDD
jgi:uncharacterized membrane protein